VGRHPFLPTAVLGDVLGRGARWVAPRRKALRDGGADAGEGDDDLQDAAEEDGSVRARADDLLRIVPHLIVEKEGRDRDELEQVENARDKSGLSHWTHLKLLLLPRLNGI
jgi:hypothetical protein